MYSLMVVDDERLMRQGIKELIDLKSLGIEAIYEAENGQEALEVLQKYSIDIILADINMPMLNGLDFAKQVKQSYPYIKIASITGYDYLDYAIQAIKIGIDDYVLKPVSKDDIQKLLIHLVDCIQKDYVLQNLHTAVEKITDQTSLETSFQKQVIQVIEEHISDEHFSLNQLAEAVGYNVTYLSSIFKKHFGMSFRDYLLDYRLEKAKIYMLSTQMKNYEVAQAVGIGDPNYFSACFKRKYHMTITEFRNKVKIS